MPRANRYFLPGKLYHLTQGCHHRQFLFKFGKDRNGYRQIMWESYQEWMGRPRHYVLINQQACLGIFRNPDPKTFQENNGV